MIRRGLILLIHAYQAVHVAFFRGSCRFYPTCSHYAIDALELHGTLKGTGLTVWRVLRCQPFCRGGFDPVPEPKPREKIHTRHEPADDSAPAVTQPGGHRRFA